MSNNEIDIALGCADSNFTKESATGVLAAEVRRLREENAAPAVPAPSVPDVLIQLRDKLTKISRRTEYLGGQQFAYVRLCEVVGEIEALLQSAPQAPAVPDWNVNIERIRDVMHMLGISIEESVECFSAALPTNINRMTLAMKRHLQELAGMTAVPAVPDEWKRTVSEFLSSHDAAWAELFKSLPADTRSVTVSNHQADAVRKANDLRALLQSADKPVVPLSGQEFDDLAYRILSLALNNGTREAFPGKLQKLLMGVTRAKQS